mmetsp:Transcript_12217/g.37261  ORF Transcript_12217/g.37261 Transcript_12217/m.37261 type:complete len:265 (+) Transcript_12217:808-1602(+)
MLLCHLVFVDRHACHLMVPSVQVVFGMSDVVDHLMGHVLVRGKDLGIDMSCDHLGIRKLQRLVMRVRSWAEVASGPICRLLSGERYAAVLCRLKLGHIKVAVVRMEVSGIAGQVVFHFAFAFPLDTINGAVRPELVPIVLLNVIERQLLYGLNLFGLKSESFRASELLNPLELDLVDERVVGIDIPAWLLHRLSLPPPRLLFLSIEIQMWLVRLVCLRPSIRHGNHSRFVSLRWLDQVHHRDTIHCMCLPLSPPTADTSFFSPG